MTDIIWTATVDNHTWRADVTRTDDYHGVLTVVRISDDLEILNEPVGLSYGALFGPDVEDVNLWGVMVIEAIDHYRAQNPEKGTSD